MPAMDRMQPLTASYRPMDTIEGIFSVNSWESSPACTPLVDFSQWVDQNGASLLPRKDSGFTSCSPMAEQKEDARRHKRKEQNRTAQRAYRERKVQRIVELEQEIELLAKEASVIENDNQQLELELCRIKTENDVIRCDMATTQHSSPASTAGNDNHNDIRVQVGPRKAIPLKDCLTVYGGLYDGTGN